MNLETRTSLLRRREELADLIQCCLGNQCRLGLLTNSPKMALQPDEWDFVDGYVVTIRLNDRNIPLTPQKPTWSDPMPDGVNCLSWQGNKEVVDKFKRWGGELAAVLRNNPGVSSEVSDDSGFYGIVAVLFAIGKSLDDSSSDMSERVILSFEDLTTAEQKKLPTLLRREITCATFHLQRIDDVLPFAMKVLDQLVGTIPRPTEELGRMLAQRFRLSKPLEEPQAAFVQCLLEANGEYRLFAWMQAQYPCLEGLNQSRLTKKLPRIIRSLIESRRGRGSRWKVDDIKSQSQ